MARLSDPDLGINALMSDFEQIVWAFSHNGTPLLSGTLNGSMADTLPTVGGTVDAGIWQAIMATDELGEITFGFGDIGMGLSTTADTRLVSFSGSAIPAPAIAGLFGLAALALTGASRMGESSIAVA